MPFLHASLCRVGLRLTLGVCLLTSRGLADDFAGGTGEVTDPYLVATAEQLISIGNDPNLLTKYYRLIDDIDLDPNRPGGEVFSTAVIASSEETYMSRRSKFTGRVYGDGHTVRHLTIDSNDGHYLGLFGYIGSGGRVYDLNLEGVDIRGAGRLGALAGYSEGSIVSCSATGDVVAGDYGSWLGGLIGINAGGLSGCRADVTVVAGDGCSILGGLAGWHEGRILNCETTGPVMGGEGAFHLGGLVGRSLGGAIEDSHATGSVSGGDRSWGLGGLGGRVDSGTLMLRCYATGDVVAGDVGHDLGGLAGQNWYGHMSYCYATGGVTAGLTSHTVGGLVGACLGGRIVASYATGSVSGLAGSRLLAGLAGHVQTASVVKDCYATGQLLVDEIPLRHGGLIARAAGPQDAHVVRCFWDIETSGAATSAAGQGLTTAQMQDRQTYEAAAWDLTGDRADGTADIWHLPEAGGYPVLTDFADANALPVLEGAGRSFDPYIIATPEDLGAVIHCDRLAWFELVADLDLSGIVWTEAPIAAFHGVFDGHGHRIRNLTVRVDGTAPVGLFGRVESGAWVYDLGLDEVSVEADDGASDLGGLAGVNAGNIVNCYVTGRIAGGAASRSLGGLVGSNRQGAIGECYATVTVTGEAGSSQLGGLLGYNFLGTVAACYAAGAVSSDAGGTRLSGLLGHNVDHSAVASCYFLVSSNLGANGLADEVIGTPLADEQMKQQASFVDWDFTKVWMICEGQTYPRFLWEQITCEP